MTKDRATFNSKPLQILLVLGENLYWSHARNWPYNLHLGFEEALQANGVEVLVLTTPWISHLAKICAGRQFDQVWVIDLTHFCHIDASLEQIVNLAPIRVGLVTESVEYHPEEYETFPWLRERRARFDAQLQYVTHVAAVDEQDVININAIFYLPTIWNPCSIPSDLLDEQVPPPSKNIAFFGGSLYGKRAKWLEEPTLRGLLARHQSANADRIYSLFFNTLPSHRWGFRRLVKQPRFPASLIYPLYLNLLRRIRRSGFIMWQQNVLQKGAAVVNLPHLVKSYSGRVIEGIGSGRPVISWQIPNRPRNTAMFEDGKEILLFNTPEELAAQIEHVLSEPSFGQQIAENARRKVKQFHTTEKRVEQILRWVETGEGPTYGIAR